MNKYGVSRSEYTNRREYENAHQRARRKFRRRLLSRFKMFKGCSECGYKKHAAALHLDHIDPSNKRVNRGGGAVDPTWGMSRLKEELSKCQVLCANCHHVRTYEENHYMVER